MRTTKLFSLALALLATTGAAGCASSDEEVSDDNSEAALSSNEVLPNGTKTVLEGVRASAAAEKQLGVRTWSAHVVHDAKSGTVGAILLGTDASEQVAYAVIVSADQASSEIDRGSLHFVRYGTAGIAQNQAFDEATKRALSAESGRVSKLLAAKSERTGLSTQTERPRLTSAAICVAPLAVGLLAAAAFAGAGAFVAASATGYEFVMVAALTHVGTSVVGVGTTVIGTGVAFAFKGWRQSCHVAIHGR